MKSTRIEKKVTMSKVVLSSALRYGRSFIETFLKTIPLFNSHFVEYKEVILNILVKLQGSTRILQSVCAHGKVEKDRSLSRIVPYVKKSLEQLIYKVKGLIDANGCSEAFSIGTLKHRNMRGEEISSQIGGDSPPHSDDDQESGDDTAQNNNNMGKSRDKENDRRSNRPRRRANNNEDDDDDAHNEEEVETNIDMDEEEEIFGGVDDIEDSEVEY